MRKKICAIYIRVSTKMQAEEGYSLDEQERILVARAKTEGYEIYAVYADAGVSGKNVNDRKEMTRLIKDIKNGKIDVVLAWNLKRAFRNLKDLLEVFEVMKLNDCIFHFEKDGIIDPTTVTGKLHAQILGMVGEIERDGISEAVSMGMSARAKMGYYNGGPVPYGYKLIRDGTQKRNASSLVIEPKEARAVKEIFRMYTEDGAGYKQITQIINKEGQRTKHGKLFSVGTVKGILCNEVYAGWIVWGKMINWAEKRRKGKNPNPIRVKGVHEAIVSQELFDKATLIRISRGGRPDRKYHDLNILTGILRCPVCGSGMVLSRSVKKSGETITYYSCGRWKNKGSLACGSNSVKLDTVNQKVLAEVSKLITDEVLTRSIIRNVNKTASNAAEGTQYDRESNEQLLRKVRADIKNLQDRFETSEDMDADLYKRRIRELRHHEEIYTQRVADCNEQASDMAVTTYTPEQIKQVMASIEPILEKREVTELRALMHLMIERIELDPKTRSVDTIKIRFNKELTDFLCLTQEGASNEAPSFLLSKIQGELTFTLRISDAYNKRF